VCCRSHSTVKCMVTVELMYQLLHQVTLAMSHCELCVTTLMYFYILCLISVSLKLQLSFHSVLYLTVKLVLCGLEFQKVPKLLSLVVDVYILVVIRNMPSLHTHTHTPTHTHTHTLTPSHYSSICRSSIWYRPHSQPSLVNAPKTK